MNKKDFVHSLKNVKLVLGNGFDLHCKLKSSFSDYFEYRKDSIYKIKSWYKRYNSQYEGTWGNKKLSLDEFNNQKLNIWDFFFVIIVANVSDEELKNYMWKDVEGSISASLISANELKIDEKLEINFKAQLYPNWDLVYKELFKSNYNSDVEVKALADVAFKILRKDKLSESEFYSFLLKQLNLFEQDFAQFLNKQLVDEVKEAFYVNGTNFHYIQNVLSTINYITCLDNVTSIDTFNYTYVKDVRINSRMHYINGDINRPIFGIDTSFPPNDPKFIFTKTSRRMEIDVFNNEVRETDEFKHVIIYGHSLNEADFSYFFPLFDKIKLDDLTSESRLIFAYSIYREDKKEEILLKLRTSISNIILNYAEERNNPSPKRFLDSLTTRNKIILLEVPEIED